MATKAANHRRNASSDKPRLARARQPWWHMVLIYPTFGLALVGAAPQWYDKYQAYKHNVHDKSFAEAQKQAALWQKNWQCSSAPFDWFNNPSNVKIDATLCPSGDIFVNAVTPDNKTHLKWVALDDVLGAAPGGGGLVGTAHAATLSAAIASARPAAQRPVRLAQDEAKVLCQKMVEGRYIHRRVQTPQGCFQEVIDTFNGTVVSRAAAPCVEEC